MRKQVNPCLETKPSLMGGPERAGRRERPAALTEGQRLRALPGLPPEALPPPAASESG
jgi:hypothetical protein